MLQIIAGGCYIYLHSFLNLDIAKVLGLQLSISRVERLGIRFSPSQHSQLASHREWLVFILKRYNPFAYIAVAKAALDSCQILKPRPVNMHPFGSAAFGPLPSAFCCYKFKSNF
jgi:hypothetical protein